MPRSVVHLPPSVKEPFTVFLSGVPQREGEDYLHLDGKLIFEDRVLKKDRVSGWRWFLGAWGVGTYRQNDSVDVRFEAPDGSPRLAEGLAITVESD